MICSNENEHTNSENCEDVETCHGKVEVLICSLHTLTYLEIVYNFEWLQMIGKRLMLKILSSTKLEKPPKIKPLESGDWSHTWILFANLWLELGNIWNLKKMFCKEPHRLITSDSKKSSYVENIGQEIWKVVMTRLVILVNIGHWNCLEIDFIGTSINTLQGCSKRESQQDVAALAMKKLNNP